MTFNRLRIYGFGFALTLILLGSGLAQSNAPVPGQNPSPVPYGIEPQPGNSQEPPESDMERRAMQELQKRQNKKRQEELKRDTDQLLKLATQLKEYVDKTNENILSVQVINKAEQIEKLAHSVKEKMKGP